MVLAATDRDTAEWSAESLGRVEVEEMSEGVSYGAESPRDGVTLGARRALHPLVLPAEVARLENLSGYLKFPGPRPVARIALRYRKRPKIAERFVPREDGEVAAGKADTAGDCPDRDDESGAAGDGGPEAGAGEERTGHGSTPVADGARAGRSGTGTGADGAGEVEPPVERPGGDRAAPRPHPAAGGDEIHSPSGQTGTAAHLELPFEGASSGGPESSDAGSAARGSGSTAPPASDGSPCGSAPAPEAGDAPAARTPRGEDRPGGLIPI